MNHIIMLLFRHVHIILNWSLRLESTHPPPPLLYHYYMDIIEDYYRLLMYKLNMQRRLR